MKRLYSPKEWPELKKEVEQWKRSGSRLAFTNGCFDILHAGHKALLAFAKKQGEILIVGLNSDASVNRLKGEGRPINNISARAQNLLLTETVDIVAVFDEDTPRAIIEYLEPDVLIKGDDYNLKTTVGAAEVRARGGKVLFFQKIPGFSTSKIIDEK